MVEFKNITFYPLLRHNMHFYTLLAICEGNPLVTDGFPAQGSTNAEIWYLLRCRRTKALEQAIWLTLIWDTMTPMWCHSNDIHMVQISELGNPRGNENPYLLTFGILWFRVHNFRVSKGIIWQTDKKCPSKSLLCFGHSQFHASYPSKLFQWSWG